MTDAPISSVTSLSTPSKKVTATKTSTAARAKPSHPPTSEMVNNAIKNLKERGGSSLKAIKKYIAANYKVDTEKSAPFIKKYLKSAVTSGTLVQTKGKGATGSFKLASAVKSTEGSAKKSASKSTKRVSKEKKAVTPSKAVSKKKSTAKKVVATSAAPKAKKATIAATKKTVASKSKTPTKTKKAAKSPTKKPKAPKPKKAVTPKTVKPIKKVASKKK